MTSGQVGKTAIIENSMGRDMKVDPGPAIAMFPTLSLAEDFSKDRFDAMVRATPTLRKLVADYKSRVAENTIWNKKFPGGYLRFVGANSPTDLSSRPIRRVYCDELDRCSESAGREGDPLSLLIKRTDNFFNRKIIISSTPTIKGHSRIEKEYDLSDRRVYLVHCPDCEAPQELLFKNLNWDSEKVDGHDVVLKGSAKYVCEHCGVLIDERHKAKMLRKGYWHAEAPGRATAGFRINSLYSPWFSWDKLAQEFLNKRKKPQELKTFVNTYLNELYEERGEAPDWEKLQARSEDYTAGVVPKGGLVLTAAADVQKDRIECEVVAWGRNLENWQVEKYFFDGDPSNIEDPVWAQLDTVLNQSYQTETGATLKVPIMALDTGYLAHQCYLYARRNAGRVMPVKGKNNYPTPISAPRMVDINFQGKKISNGAKLWTVGTDILKTEFYAWLRLPRPEDGEPFPYGFIHLPSFRDAEWYKQITAEELIEEQIKTGGTRRKWVKVYERNEDLDMRIYGRAATYYLGLDRLTDREWSRLEKRVAAVTSDRPARKPAAKRRRKKGHGGIRL